MLFFGHAGVTLGIALAAKGVAHRFYPVKDGKPEPGAIAVIRRLDLRLLIVGSLLPDIIDKPLGLIILRDSISYGRIYSHTLLFLILLALGGWLLYRFRRQTWLIVLAVGAAGHHILDLIWLSPSVFFWPFLGTTFPRENPGNYLEELLYGLLHEPLTLATEVIGLVSAIIFAIWLLRKKKVLSFFKGGK